MTVGEGGAPPSLFLHTQTVYDRMKEEAATVPSDLGDALVWEGHFTKLITQELQFAIPYYTSIRAALMGMGSLVQLKRGGGSSASLWQLCGEPTLDAFTRYMDRNSKSVSKTAQNTAQIRDLASRVEILEESIGEMLDMLREKEAS